MVDAVKVYIAGPMTGIPGHNFPAFFAAEEILRAQGHEVLNPARNGVCDGWTWADYMRRDLPMLAQADEVHVLPGWHHSRGARLEVHVAHALGMPVREVEA